MFLKRQEFDKTEGYLKEAIAKSEDNEAKAEYYLKMAQLQLAKKQYQATKTNALEVLKLNPNNGTALMLIGKAYANSASNYGEDDFDHASVFWAAVDKFQKAKQVDPAMTEEADKLIGIYSQHFRVKTRLSSVVLPMEQPLKSVVGSTNRPKHVSENSKSYINECFFTYTLYEKHYCSSGSNNAFSM